VDYYRTSLGLVFTRIIMGVPPDVCGYLVDLSKSFGRAVIHGLITFIEADFKAGAACCTATRKGAGFGLAARPMTQKCWLAVPPPPGVC